ncbi:MAG: hypothetical protein CSB24_03650 [Deltaproteobacteria bacterium]|nr:MAG: hypothetical protein CSB24_03650 [Deltaproteobacteria bacterium]
MRKNTWFAILITAPLLANCASQSEVQRLQYQLRVMNKKMQEMERSKVDQIQKSQASSLNQIDQLKSEILSLKGQLEETHHQNRLLKEQSKEFANSFDNYTHTEAQKWKQEQSRIQAELAEKERKINQLNSQLRVHQKNLANIQQARVQEAERRAKAAKKAAEMAARKAAAVSNPGSIPRIRPSRVKVLRNVSPLPVRTEVQPVQPEPVNYNQEQPEPKQPEAASVQEVKTDNKPAPKAEISRAESLFQVGKYAEAYNQYDLQADSAASQDARLEAMFMMGECLFKQGLYNDAAMEYQQILHFDPSHAKAPKAMLRQAEALEKVNDQEAAKVVYKKIISRFGDTREAADARARMEKM